MLESHRFIAMAEAQERITKLILLILIVTSSFLLPALSDLDFDFPSFNQSSLDNINLEGNADPFNNIIYLTNSIYNKNFNWN